MRAHARRGLDFLRDAAWLTPDRARAYCRVLLVLTLTATAGWVIASRSGVDPLGKPLGTDFISFWTASELALEGRPAAAYDAPIHHAAEIALFGSRASRYTASYTAFFYPPVFLLICLPLAALPYLPSLLAWLGLTGIAYWRCLRAILPQPEMIPALLAYPAWFLNAGHGQNGFLTATLFGGAMLTLETRPALAGLCFGSLIYKPHLGIIIPLSLLAARRWKAFFAAAGAALGLVALSVVTLGTTTWRAFFGAAPLARLALEHNLVGAAKMPSVFAAVRLLHGGLAASYTIQGIVSLAVAVALVIALRSRVGGGGEGALIAVASLIVSPFLLDYDLTVLALPLAWVMSEAMRGGFLPWEKSTLAAGFMLPLLSRTVAMAFGIPLGPPILLGVFCAVWRRVRCSGRDAQSRRASGGV